MLEKIGLPGKPSLRGNNWVVDSSHCQGCSSQFSFINRKHHCRRCGGLFCNSCTAQRMVLRGQGDSPVRICEPCKKLEEAARFEKRYGHKNIVGRGDSKLLSKNEDEVRSQNYDGNGKDSLLPRRESNYNPVSDFQNASSSASHPNNEYVLTQNKGEDTLKSLDDPNRETKSVSPDELRQHALNEKTKYRLLKVEGKSEEALKAFKRGKELEREAAALEIHLRRNRKKALSTSNTMEVQNVKYDPKDSEKKVNNSAPKSGKEKDDLAAELRQLGWSDMDLHEVDKKPANVSLEGELSSLIREASQKSSRDSVAPIIDKTEVLALKKKALALKREGKLGEAKEELKKAKILEKQLEEQELLAEGEESDDELSLLIRNLDDDKKNDLLLSFKRPEQGFDFDNLMGIDNDVGLDSNFDVTDEDMDDPEIAAALNSLGWTEDSKMAGTIVSQPVQVDRDALVNEIQSLKREALNQKRTGNTSDAMTLLKKAKLLEKDLDNVKSDDNMLDVEPKAAPKSRIMIQRELLGLKKKALTLKREGRLNEADEELKKAKALEQQLEEVDNAKQGNNGKKQSDISIPMDFKADVEQVEEDITDQDMNDPSYLSVLQNLGWNDEDNQVVHSKPSKQNDSLSQPPIASSSNQVSSSVRVVGSRRSKGEIQRELLGLKRKALTLRRQGNPEEAEEVLLTAKTLEDQIAEMEAPKSDIPVETVKLVESETIQSNSKINPASLVDATKEQYVISNKVASDTDHPITMVEQKSQASSKLTTNLLSSRDRFKLQQQSLAHKRQSLKLRREGRIEEAEAEYKLAKDLETQLEESAVNTSVAVAEPVDNVGIEDLLDPQLLSALKSVGLENVNPVPQGSERGETTQISMANAQKSNANLVTQGSQRQETAQTSVPTARTSERIKLEEQIKAEKVKAVTLKRSGKKAEALDALRQAKLFEKKLSSLDS